MHQEIEEIKKGIRAVFYDLVSKFGVSAYVYHGQSTYLGYLDRLEAQFERLDNLKREV